ncbi:caspase family protein [Actinoplanes utahensis]|uniref:Peptidase C14 caspase domain-containing protein n=1 Tax=Actinoplanes utahensis TaxID=1869 RepID=A0A0A6X5J3_ACTUT|nr:caspase family protein [Actinoplanes utahensis]KHD75382.1 hypothetical protein MB27_23415 [Actinoplanes utahensis]GIF33705.1 hypothetical protein Aut01nite_66910 [Actinoplanes utahensis]
MSAVYALLVGVDRYAASDSLVPDLRGCGNDVTDVLAMLRTTVRPGTGLHPLVLRDEQATLSGVVAALRTHLTQAGPDDTALFWFSGHGSQAKAPADAWVVEGTGMVQTLVCHDSRTAGVPDLWDKELSVLLDVVAARAGHVAVVLDSCHSDSGTRVIGSRSRSVPPGPDRATRTLSVSAPPAPEHVALAACRREQKAEEREFDGTHHGLFTWTLLRALRRLGPSATYAELLAAARSEVARRGAFRQVPQLYPATSELTGMRFLRGEAGAARTGVTLSSERYGWQIDAGRAHGLPSDPAGLRFGVPGTGWEVRVDEVRPELSLVTPLPGWRPDPDRQYPVAITALPRPVATVAGADVSGSPYLRAAEDGEPVTLTVTAAGPGRAHITDRQGRTVEVDAAPEQVTATLEHVARWLWLRDELRNDGSRLGEPIRLEFVPVAPEQTVEDLGGRSYQAEYTWDGTRWTAPEIHLHLHNTADRQLYVTVLDLTPGYAVHAKLFPPAPIGAGRKVAAMEGRRIRISLPASEPPEPGRSNSDWLVVVASERPFAADPYLLPRLGIGSREVRDMEAVGPPTSTGGDWTVQRYELRTRVPNDAHYPHDHPPR